MSTPRRFARVRVQDECGGVSRKVARDLGELAAADEALDRSGRSPHADRSAGGNPAASKGRTEMGVSRAGLLASVAVYAWLAAGGAGRPTPLVAT